MLGRSLGLLGAVAGMLLLSVAACDDETETDGTGGSTSGTGGSVGGTGGTGGSTSGTGGDAGSGGGAPVCGNGVVEAGEECEPPNTATCDANCMNIGTTPCDDADSYDTDCEGVPQGQWCWDGGDGGELFCGCDPNYGDVDCQVEGYEYCNPATNLCEPPTPCGVDANEPNDDEASATPVTIDTPIDGATCANDTDWFTFQATGPVAAITASWTDDGETDLDLRVTDCAGTQLASSLSTDPASEVVAASGLTAGTDYCVLVEHWSGAAGGADAAYSLVVEIPTCGNNAVEGGELCDGTDLDSNDCTTLGFSGGTLACNANCVFWDYSQCTMSAPVCGDNAAEGFEDCDGTDMGGATGVACADLGFTGGTISCTADCHFDLTTCTGGQPGWTCRADYYNDGYCDCGCGVADPDCADATVGSCEYCNDIGSCNGYADCADPNSIINPTDNAVCTAATCGNNTAEAFEVCDGTDLRGLTCTDLGLGFGDGTLACNASCEHDTTGCPPATCGDDVAEGFEWCDGTDLGGNTCASLDLGFASGTLACSASCNYDTTGCTYTAVCGDDVAGGDEQCDGTDLGQLTGVTCADAGFTGGTITCTNCLWDLTTCTGGTAGWTCPQNFYNAQDGCDCGCGVMDPDCADATVGSCDYCDDIGSCNTGVPCPGNINATDNSQCS